MACIAGFLFGIDSNQSAYAQSDETGSGGSATDTIGCDPTAACTALAGTFTTLEVVSDAGVRGNFTVDGDAGIAHNLTVGNQIIARAPSGTDGLRISNGARLCLNADGGCNAFIHMRNPTTIGINIGSDDILRVANTGVTAYTYGISAEAYIENGTTAPVTIQDAQGFRITGVAAASTASCTAGRDGTFQWYTDTKKLNVCNGATTTWLELPAESKGMVAATIDFASVSNGACVSNTGTLTGALVDTPIACSFPAALEDGLTSSCQVSATDTVTWRLCNVTAAPIDPASGNYSARYFKP